MEEISEEWIRQRPKKEWRDAKEAAAIFVNVCKRGDADDLYDASRLLYEVPQPDKAWRLTMREIAKLHGVSPQIRGAFLPIWVEAKTLARDIGNRPVLAAALRVLMPATYTGPPLDLYRGAASHEASSRKYGFSWTTDATIARDFAEGRANILAGGKETKGVILKTSAQPGAIMLVRRPEDYYDEGEVVVDPFRLDKIEVVERLAPRAGGDAGAAAREAERVATAAAGAVAFSRTGDPASGEFEDAVVIKRFGEAPDAEALLGGD